MRFGMNVGGVYVSGGIIFWMVAGPLIAAGAVAVFLLRMIGWALASLGYEISKSLYEASEYRAVRRGTAKELGVPCDREFKKLYRTIR